MKQKWGINIYHNFNQNVQRKSKGKTSQLQHPKSGQINYTHLLIYQKKKKKNQIHLLTIRTTTVQHFLHFFFK